MMHAALDYVDELDTSKWKKRNTKWIGKLCPMEETVIYGEYVGPYSHYMERFHFPLSLSHTHTCTFSSLCHPDQCQNASHGAGSSSRIGSQAVLCKSALRLRVCTMLYHSLTIMSHLFVCPAEQTARTLYSVHFESIYQTARANCQQAL